VAGDSNQLPPTAFFVADDDEPEYEEEGTLGSTAGFESLLDTMNAFVRSRPLDWHYRSRDESLISFSNHYIYKGRLVTFPGPGGPSVLTHDLVQQIPGLDAEEESSGAEVRRVVELILEHAEKHPHESLGVITMGIKHADRLQRALDQACSEGEELHSFLDPNLPERFFIKNLEKVQGDERDAIILSIGYGKDRGENLKFRFGPLLSIGGRRRLNVAVTRARQRMTVVSSFSHLDMDPSRVRVGTGVELLRNYLHYAASAGKELSDAEVTESPVNAFEAEVYDVLTSQGISLIPQMGASRFRIDFVAQHPMKPGRFVLAIECDGASYHSSPTARDRDRLRQTQLENLGWRFHRIWSTDWFMRKDDEVRRTVEVFQRAVKFADSRDLNESNMDGGASMASPSAVARNQPNAATTPASRRRPRPQIFRKPSIEDYSPNELVELVRWINSDGQLRTDEQIICEILPELGFARRGVRIENAIQDAIRRLNS
jgi:very-short-patch-repair endonuclease